MGGAPGQRFLLPFLALALSAIALWPTLSNGWVNWDDHLYIDEYIARHDLSAAFVAETFGTLHVNGAYHPLTNLSWAVDYSIGGMDAGSYHRTNLWLHLLNVGLVFGLVQLLFREHWLAFFVAVLFGLHPMHLEAVAWISARKELLYTSFYLPGLMAWVQFLRSGRRAFWYAVAALCFVLALLSKGVAVSFPLVLLAIDYLEGRSLRARTPWLEKLPLLAISIVFGLVAFFAQRANGAMDRLDAIPLYVTLLGSSHGLWLYLAKTVVPFQLSAFHPYPAMEGGVVPWYFLVSPLVLIALGALVWRTFRGNRRLMFGLAFFLITTAPVIKLLPFGGAFIAERFTYLPYMGLFVVMGVLVATAMQTTVMQRGIRNRVLMAAVTAYVLALGACTWTRTEVWQHGGTLWTDAIDHYPEHHLGYMNRGAWWASQGDLDRAETDMLAGLAHAPDSASVYRDVAFMYLVRADHDEALRYSEAGLQLEPDDPDLWLNLGISQQKLGRASDALRSMSRAVELDPRNYSAHLNRGFLHQDAGRDTEALEDYSAAIGIDPYNPVGHRYRGGFHLNRGQWQEAVKDFSRAIEIAPGHGETHAWRSRAYRALERYPDALTDAQRARELGTPMGDGYEVWLKKRIDR